MTTESLPPLESRLLDPMEDHFGLIELFDTVFGHTVTPAMWYWKYVPKWTSRHYCYVGRVDGKVVGYFGAVPLRGIIDGEEVAYFQLADLMVHPKYRLKYDYFQIGSDHILADIRRSHPRHLVYGFSGHAAFRYLKKRKIGGFVERARTRYVRTADAPANAPYEFDDWTWSAAEIDAVWDAWRPTMRAGLVRDQDYLMWRYGSHPVHNYRLLGVRSGSETIGYLVLGNDRPGEHNRAKEIPVVDMLLPDAHAEPVMRSLAGFLDNDVMLWLPDHRASGFAEDKDSGTHCYHYLKESAATTEFLGEHLYYTMGDVDWW